jgi:hypothetical protein
VQLLQPVVPHDIHRQLSKLGVIEIEPTHLTGGG